VVHRQRATAPAGGDDDRGEFSNPTNWIRTGNAVGVVDSYAKAHTGTAPVLTFVDSNGSFNNDTECVNGPRGNAADHLAKDVRP
jgi:hypothetical protein